MDPQQAQAMHALMAMAFVMPFFFLIFAAVVIIPMWFIWKKAGFSPWLSLLMVFPLINLIMLYVLAFTEWKVVPVAQPVYQPPQYPRV